jgi:hypothetical protein
MTYHLEDDIMDDFQRPIRPGRPSPETYRVLPPMTVSYWFSLALLADAQCKPGVRDQALGVVDEIMASRKAGGHVPA